MKADINSRETVVVVHVLAHSFHRLPQRFDVSLVSVNGCQLCGVDLDGNDVLWVTSAKQGDDDYHWHETPRV